MKLQKEDLEVRVTELFQQLDRMLERNQLAAYFQSLTQDGNGKVDLEHMREGLVKLSAAEPEGAKSGWYVLVPSAKH